MSDNPFVPQIPEKMTDFRASGREVHLIELLRKYDFCKITVHKMNGRLARIEITNTQLLKEDEGIALAAVEKEK